MYEREENAPFSLISYSKERRFRVFQTMPDSWKKKLIQDLRRFLKLVYYRGYLSKIWRNSKIHDCQPILENYRHWLLNYICPLRIISLSQRPRKGPLAASASETITFYPLTLISSRSEGKFRNKITVASDQL